MLNRGIYGRVRLEVLGGLDSAVGGDDTTHGSPLDSRGANRDHLVANGVEGGEQNDRQAHSEEEHQPAVPAEVTGSILICQCHEEGCTRNNLPPGGYQSLATRYWIRCAMADLGGFLRFRGCISCSNLFAHRSVRATLRRGSR